METIDGIQIQFDGGQLVFLNICLGFLMLSVALDIRYDDFKAVFRAPKLPIVGLISQWLLLPLLSLVLIYSFRPPPYVALGMILVAVCPGGTISNYAVHLAKGNAALSVLLTTISTLATIFIVPIAFSFWANWIPEAVVGDTAIQIDWLEMIKILFLVTLCPLLIGMYLTQQYPLLIQKVKPILQRTAFFLFIFFIIGVIITNYDNLFQYVYIVFPIILVFQSLALIMGYYFARLAGLKPYNAKVISIETGIQNTALAFLIIFNFFDNKGGMAVIAVCWGIWHLISVFLLALWWGRTTKESTLAKTYKKQDNKMAA